MKAGILTFQFADNYGAVLQCYALQEACSFYGAEACVIDYIPKQMISNKTKIRKKILPRGFEKSIEQFRKQYLNRSTVKETYDRVLIGSDQVWNLGITGEDDFWIAPKLSCKMVCSYAASFGKGELSEKEEAYFSKYQNTLKNYGFLTVRENSAKKILEKIGVSSETVCDPTFLFYKEPKIYERLAETSEYRNKAGYILVYSLEYAKEIDEITEKVKRETGMSIISLHPMNDRIQTCDEFASDARVEDFLALIRNASCIVTNSFHGLAFSYIFRKQVYCVHHSLLSSRQAELLNASGFEAERISEKIYHIDCGQSSKKLDDYVDNSQKILKKMLTE